MANSIEALIDQTQERVPANYDFTPGSFVWVDSPNFNDRPEGTVVDTIVLHHTASASLSGTVRWFENPASQVSAHFTIGKDGTIVQHVSTFKRAWHAGASRDMNGRERVNDFSIGIEMVNVGDGKDPWTPEQVRACANLVSAMMRRFPIKYIVSHEKIAQPPGRKNDPLGFPWQSMERFGVTLWY